MLTKEAKYELVVGLEVHVQLATHSKIFSYDSAEFGEQSNTLVSPLILGHPGTLPVLNSEAVNHGIRLGLALGGQIADQVDFDRKHYFYPDLPKGYQITQNRNPICNGGKLTIRTKEGSHKAIRIHHAHLEEDAGKSLHHDHLPYSLVDLNRSGVPLMEVVTEPDIRTSEEAAFFLHELRRLITFLGVSNGNMEEGSMRCDANISVRPLGQIEYGKRCEIKNMNSMKFVQKAIEVEYARQVSLLETGQNVEQETRGYDAETNSTYSMRSKEHAHDYRYMPEPDLQPYSITSNMLESLRNSMPKTPHALESEYVLIYNLSAYDAQQLTSEKWIAEAYESLVATNRNYKQVCNFICGPLRALVNDRTFNPAEFKHHCLQFDELINLIVSNEVSYSIAMERMLPILIKDASNSPKEIANRLNLIQNSDEAEIKKLAQEILAEWPDKVLAYKKGNKGMLGLFMGEMKKKSAGKADPKKANTILLELLQD